MDCAKYPIILSPTQNRDCEDEWREKLDPNTLCLFLPRLITVFSLLSFYPHGRLLQHTPARGFSLLSVFLFSARPRFAPYFNPGEGVKRGLCCQFCVTESRKGDPKKTNTMLTQITILLTSENRRNPEKIPTFLCWCTGYGRKDFRDELKRMDLGWCEIALSQVLRDRWFRINAENSCNRLKT